MKTKLEVSLELLREAESLLDTTDDEARCELNKRIASFLKEPQKHQYVRYFVARGPFKAISAEYWTSNPLQWALGMRAALTLPFIRESGIVIEVRERASLETKNDWSKPGRLVKRICGGKSMMFTENDK